MGILERKNSAGEGVGAGKHGVLSTNGKHSSLAGAELSAGKERAAWRNWASVTRLLDDKNTVG